MNKPPFLQPGDSIAIVAPAKRVLLGEIDFAVDIFEKWQLKPVLGKYIYESDYYLAGKDELRKHDLQEALDEPSIKAIFCARGGYGTTRIIDDIDFTTFVKQPKWLIGFSDITVLHQKINSLGIASIHGVMPFLFEKRASVESLQTLYSYLFGSPLNYLLETSKYNREGAITAPIVGGNLSLIIASLGTTFQLDFKNKILFLEEVGENFYAIDRMINHLRLLGVFKEIKGLIIGAFNGMKDDEEAPFHYQPIEIICYHTRNYNFPIAYGFPAGHIVDNRALPLGVESLFIVTKKEASISISSKGRTPLIV